MKISTIIITLLISLISFPVFSGEVTDKEFDMFRGDLIATYYHGANGEVNCTAFNQQGKAIGGGRSYAQGGVARVRINVPKKYLDTELKVSCK